MNGFLNLNKPTGRTSSDLVVFVRKRLPRGTAVGHGGTLDPEASGVLPVCVGSATRLFDYIIDKQKVYVARLRLGIETDTQDATGRVVAEYPVDAGEAELRAVLPRFTGNILQIPTMYSALKRDGKRLYQLARKGESVALEPRPCRVDAIEYLRDEGGGVHALRIRCGKGVYIREGEQVLFKKIKVIYEGSDYVLSESTNDPDYLALYDDIMIEGVDADD